MIATQSTSNLSHNISRFKTRAMRVGNLWMGGDHPIVVQSMTTTDTMDIEGTVNQTIELANVGCQVVRITAPTVQDAEALREIRDQVRARGCDVPLVADIHFLPAAALIAADYVEKVRINPGNYADRKLFKTREYTDAEYQEELDRIHEKFKPLVLKLKDLGRALRIGTNHGSLSDRIMNRFGDTPEGMVESAFEFAEICRAYDFHNFCFSMKASNVQVMTTAYRLLVERQIEKGWDYPVHLGVTEAGFGEDARIKSSIGIGTLLAEGIGDTIRVSLTEKSVNEIPVARALAARFPKTIAPRLSPSRVDTPAEPLVPEVWTLWRGLDQLKLDLKGTDLRPDTIYLEAFDEQIPEIHFLKTHLKVLFSGAAPKLAVKWDASWFDDERVRRRVLSAADYIVEAPRFAALPVRALRFVGSIDEAFKADPINSVFRMSIASQGLDRVIEASSQAGSAYLSANFRGVLLEAMSTKESLELGFGILQATRRRMSRTEYISCPSCGRTLFDLEETTAKIKSATEHLKGVKIAVMGCIVNGPGEMADADFGYVGGAPGRINLYVGKECVERNIPSVEATMRLVELIKKHNRWCEPQGSSKSFLPKMPKALGINA